MSLPNGDDIKRIIMKNINQKADMMYVDDNISDAIEGLVDGVTDAIVTALNATIEETSKAFREINKRLR